MFVLLLSTLACAGVEDPTHLPAPFKTRRLSGIKRVKPAASTELPFDSKIENGRGWNHHTEQFVARPFEPYKAALVKFDTALEVEYHKKVITSTSEYSEAMRTTGYIQGGGWGLSLKASFSRGRVTGMKSKDALFILHASKELGFEGWRFSQVPDFTPVAKAKLCEKGVYTPEKFEELYGTYFVRGIRKATALDVMVKLETETTFESQKVSASLEASWSGFGFSVGGGFSFAKQVSEEQSESRVSVFAKAYGTTKNFLPVPDMNNLDTIIEEYKKVSNEGVGIALALSRYDDHPEYIKIQHECGRTFESLDRDEFWMDKYVDVAVEAQLFAEEVLSEPFTKCGADLANAAFKMYDELVSTPEDQLSPDGYTTALHNLHNLKKLWQSPDDLQTCLYEAYVTALHLTGCPNDVDDPRQVPAWWTSDSKAESFENMYKMCRGSSDGSATEDMRNACCGLGVECEPKACAHLQENIFHLRPQGELGGPNDGSASDLSACWGECDSDSQCKEGLKCFQRDGLTPVPGCKGLGKKGWDYCYDPTGSIELSGGNDGSAKNLRACTGECDSDAQCASGLKCFQRSDGETIPGCTGSGAGKDWDYCYDPKWTANGGPHYMRYPDAAIKGHNTEHIPSVSVSACKGICNSKSWCKSFDYWKASGECDLSDKAFDDVDGFNTNYANNEFDHYEKVTL